MCAAQPYDAFAADVWSLGVCLFALLARVFPFEEARFFPGEATPAQKCFRYAVEARLNGLS